MAKSKTHDIVVRVRFDEKITKSEAVKEFRDIVNGDFYPGAYCDAQEMKITSVKGLPNAGR